MRCGMTTSVSNLAYTGRLSSTSRSSGKSIVSSREQQMEHYSRLDDDDESFGASSSRAGWARGHGQKAQPRRRSSASSAYSTSSMHAAGAFGGPAQPQMTSANEWDAIIVFPLRAKDDAERERRANFWRKWVWRFEHKLGLETFAYLSLQEDEVRAKAPATRGTLLRSTALSTRGPVGSTDEETLSARLSVARTSRADALCFSSFLQSTVRRCCRCTSSCARRCRCSRSGPRRRVAHVAFGGGARLPVKRG